MIKDAKQDINVFTTSPDTIFGASFLAVSVDHPICANFKQDDNLYNKFKVSVLRLVRQRRL